MFWQNIQIAARSLFILTFNFELALFYDSIKVRTHCSWCVLIFLIILVAASCVLPFFNFRFFFVCAFLFQWNGFVCSVYILALQFSLQSSSVFFFFLVAISETNQRLAAKFVREFVCIIYLCALFSVQWCVTSHFRCMHNTYTHIYRDVKLPKASILALSVVGKWKRNKKYSNNKWLSFDEQGKKFIYLNQAYIYKHAYIIIICERLTWTYTHAHGNSRDTDIYILRADAFNLWVESGEEKKNYSEWNSYENSMVTG